MHDRLSGPTADNLHHRDGIAARIRLHVADGAEPVRHASSAYASTEYASSEHASGGRHAYVTGAWHGISQPARDARRGARLE